MLYSAGNAVVGIYGNMVFTNLGTTLEGLCKNCGCVEG